MRDFIDRCAHSGKKEQADVIREAKLLFLLDPAVSAMGLGSYPSVATLEGMLASGAAESAALALLGDQARFKLSRGIRGECLASVMLPHRDHEATAAGQTLALALVGAKASALLEPEV